MKEHFITIRIAAKEYSLKASPADEAKLREAGRRINEKIREMELKGVLDRQDLLAMVSFNLMVELLGNESTDARRGHKLDELNDEAKRILSQ